MLARSNGIDTTIVKACPTRSPLTRCPSNFRRYPNMAANTVAAERKGWNHGDSAPGTWATPQENPTKPARSCPGGEGGGRNLQIAVSIPADSRTILVGLPFDHCFGESGGGAERGTWSKQSRFPPWSNLAQMPAAIERKLASNRSIEIPKQLRCWRGPMASIQRL